MTREEIIVGLQFTIDMFLLDPSTGETFEEPRNDMDKTTIDACKGAIELLEQEPCEDCISRQDAIKVADAVWTVTGDKNVAKVWQQIKDLPSAQPERKTGH